MMRQGIGLLGGLILAWGAFAAPAGEVLPESVDLRAEAAQAAKAGGPLVVIFSRADCRFCQAVKRDFLLPMSRDGKRGARVVIREIGQDRDAALIGFDGRATTHAEFAAAEKVKLVPVVAFYGPNGRKLADPIVGARLPDFYQSYLDEAVEQSARALKKP